MEMSDESEEEDWFVGHMKREAEVRGQRGTLKTGIPVIELLQ